MKCAAPSYSGQTPFFLRSARKGGLCITGFGPVDGGSKQKLFFLGKKENLLEKENLRKKNAKIRPGLLQFKKEKRKKNKRKK